MTNKETKMTIKELEAWSLYAANAAAGILAGDRNVYSEKGLQIGYVTYEAALIADRLLEERRKRI